MSEEEIFAGIKNFPKSSIRWTNGNQSEKEDHNGKKRKKRKI